MRVEVDVSDFAQKESVPLMGLNDVSGLILVFRQAAVEESGNAGCDNFGICILGQTHIRVSDVIREVRGTIKVVTAVLGIREAALESDKRGEKVIVEM